MLLALFSLASIAQPSRASHTAYNIDGRLAQYGRAFPSIHFVRLTGERDIGEALMLQRTLGAGARDLTYEHDPADGGLLIEAQVQRIALMLANDLPSATLFAVGDGSDFPTPYVCVISLNATRFRTEPLAATRLLLGELGVDAEDLAVGVRVDNEHFLAFTLDHEVFHCLDAYLNGPPIRRTRTEIEGCYEFFRAEQRAELFAALVLRGQDEQPGHFLSTLADYRTLALLDWDYMHYTVPALHAAQVPRRDEIAAFGLSDLARYASKLADETIVSRQAFPDFLAAAHHVAMQRGVVAASTAPEADELQDTAKDRRQVIALETALSTAQRTIAGFSY
ncbi:MAG: hypothetical protein AMJ69_08680 [Gammaproteobacteria bacterium SG8_47]|nr:MAG: hypothetical protein AMJ69_08680 [Gammaproteobacteria bacterium SG8_47]